MYNPCQNLRTLSFHVDKVFELNLYRSNSNILETQAGPLHLGRVQDPASHDVIVLKYPKLKVSIFIQRENPFNNIRPSGVLHTAQYTYITLHCKLLQVDIMIDKIDIYYLSILLNSQFSKTGKMTLTSFDKVQALASYFSQ